MAGNTTNSCMKISEASVASAPPAASKQIASAIPGARYEEIPNALHFPNVERPAAFNKAMRGFLDGLK